MHAVLLSHQIIPNTVPFASLDCLKAWAPLTEKERQYAYHVARASWEGSKAVLFSTSVESPIIFSIYQKLFATEDVDALKASALASGVSDEDFLSFLTYAAAFYSNMGNYKSFGDSKFIPGVSQEVFLRVLQASAADTAFLAALFDECKERMYSTEERFEVLGFAPDAVTTYYSANCTEEDSAAVQVRVTGSEWVGDCLRALGWLLSGDLSEALRKPLRVSSLVHTPDCDTGCSRPVPVPFPSPFRPALPERQHASGYRLHQPRLQDRGRRCDALPAPPRLLQDRVRQTADCVQRSPVRGRRRRLRALHEEGRGEHGASGRVRGQRRAGADVRLVRRVLPLRLHRRAQGESGLQ